MSRSFTRTVPLLLLLLTLVGCGRPTPGDPGGGDAQEPVRILSFTASPIEVFAGEPVEIAWEVEGAEAAYLSPTFSEVPQRDRTTVWPIETTRYRVSGYAGEHRASAEVEVRVLPRIEPQVTTVVAGDSQEFWVSGLPTNTSQPGFLASGGVMESNGLRGGRWTAPQEPGSYVVRTHVRGKTLTHEVEVVALPPRRQSLGVVTGAIRFEEERALIVDGSGTLWARTPQGLFRRPAEGDAWLLSERGLDLQMRQLAAGPGGTAWTVGWADGNGMLGRWNEAAASWELELLPSDQPRTLAAGLDGSLAVATDDGLLHRASSDAPWQAFPRRGGLGPVAVGHDGTVYGSGWRLHPDRGEWETLPRAPVGAANTLLVDAGGQLHACGSEGVAWLTASDEWRRPSALDYPCSAIAARDDGDVFVVSGGPRTELWRLADFGPGVFALPGEAEPGYGGSALAVSRDGTVLLGSRQGLWQLPPGEDTLVPANPGGLPNAVIRAQAFVPGPDGSIGVSGRTSSAGWPESTVVGVDRRLASGSWQRTIVDPSGSRLTNLVPAGSGRWLALETLWGRLFAIGPNGAERRDTIDHEGNEISLHGIAKDGAGTLFALARFRDGIFRWSDTRARWEPFADMSGFDLQTAPDGGIWVLGYELVSLQTTGPAQAHEIGGRLPLPPSARFERVQTDWLGRHWALTNHWGVVRLEGDTWKRVGGGVCSTAARGLLVTSDRRVLCAGEDRLYELDDRDRWVPFEERWAFVDARTSLFPELEPVEMVELPSGAIWLAPPAGGVFELRDP